jgi:hypothetical protein
MPSPKPKKKLAIVQSSYIPWKGYFDLIAGADEFILFDDLQFTRRDWRNRNRIKARDKLIWLTIPVRVKGKYLQKIRDTVISDPKWTARHWRSITHNYSKSRYFKEYRDLFEDLYLGSKHKFLSEINYRFLIEICRILGIKTKISWSADYQLVEGKTERLVHLCKQAGASAYISGPSAKEYIDESLFAEEDISLSFADYSGYPEYNQLFPPFEHRVSIIDLIFSEGPNATRFMKSF